MPLPVRNTPNQIYYSQVTGSLSRAIFENPQFSRGKKFPDSLARGFTLLCVIFVPNIPEFRDGRREEAKEEKREERGGR